MKIINYNIDKYPFRKAISSYLKCDKLEKIHLNSKHYDTMEVDTDQSTDFHQSFYQAANRKDSEFIKVYTNFIRNEVTKEIEDDIIYQKYPTFRIHLPDNLAVGGWHKDRDYNHSTHEINFWVPVTDAWGTNTIWCESDEDKKDFKAVEVKHGEALIFNGANLTHGNKTNTTEHTRVSFDFRVVKKSEFTPTDTHTITNHKKFKIGDYFEELK